MFGDIFNNKKVIITGHSGFKGSWLSLWLHYLGAEIYGISNSIPSNPSNFHASKISDYVKDFKVDITNKKLLKQAINDIRPDFIFHLAAQALVGDSYDHPLETFMTNTIGSANILKSVEEIGQDVVVIMITSDKAYENKEWLWGYRESDELGGKDPYSASKAMAEIAIRSINESFLNNSKIKIATARAGNVIGGGDWAKNRIVPDCARAWSKKELPIIRNPYSTRPWQHVLEPLSGYLLLAQKISENDKHSFESYNFGPMDQINYSVKNLIEKLSNYWPGVSWKNQNVKTFNEAGLLRLNCDKASSVLGWRPTLSFEETAKYTAEWYKYFYDEPDRTMDKFSLEQIKSYSLIAKSKKILWAYE